MKNILGKLISYIEYAGTIGILFVNSLYFFIKGSIDIKRTIEFMSTMGVDSLPIVMAVSIFAGMMISLQATKQAIIYGATQFVGAGVAFLMARELAPVLTAIVMAGKVGSAFASEIGSMKITEQLDALRALATNPIEYLVVPRLLSLIIMVPIIMTISGISAVICGYIVFFQISHNPLSVYLSTITTIVSQYDILCALIKSVVFATTICLVGCAEGFRTEGGAAGVGKATTSSVVVSIVLVFFLDYIMSLILFK